MRSSKNGSRIFRGLDSNPPLIHIIGASGRSGTALSAAVRARGQAVIPVVRAPEKWSGPELVRKADLRDPTALQAALAGATHIVTCAHARHAGAVIAAAPPEAVLIFLGSTRKFTRWPDEHGDGVLAGEKAFLASDRRGVMLHPTMIYGARGENNVQRLAAVLRKLPVVPLPDGGRALVQPVHQDDLTGAIITALDTDWTGPDTLVIAGPTPLPYADFVRAVAAADRQPQPRIMGFPAGPLIAAAWIARCIPFLPDVRPSEIRRLLEDKAFDIGPARARLGLEPMALEKGLARTFARTHDP